MKLRELIENIDIVTALADPEMEISGVCIDSRKVKEGDLFIAVRGYESDGHRYIGSAVKGGAACVVCEVMPADISIPYVIVKDSRASEALIAANFFKNPAREMTIIGVTGTNGKTTVTNLVKQIIEGTLHEKTGLIGTNRNVIGDKVLETERTTPDSLELHELLRRMADEGCRYVVMEVSSHALYLSRVLGIHFAVAAFTNLTEDHLDFHKTMDNYAEAKSKLFTMCDSAVINLDDPYAGVMLGAAKCPAVTFSTEKNEADLTAKDIRLGTDGVSFCAVTMNGIVKLKMGIPGMFSVYNALTAVLIAEKLGIDLSDASQALAQCTGVKGRAEIVPTDTDFTVMIDYAHTPDALRNILNTVRGFTKGRIILLFGCGGDREHEKRHLMGEIAAKMADYIVITSDNPRTEAPEKIIEQIQSGMKGTEKPYEVVVSRREAIGAALMQARAGDVVLLCGKGHETYQIIGKEKSHFDEREIVAGFLKPESEV